MKGKLKIKSIAIILTFVMIFQYVSVIVPLFESIAGTYIANIDEVTWTYDLDEEENAINVKPDKDKMKGTIDIPRELNGHVVKSIAEYAFSNCYYLTGVTIPNSVTEIGKYAFWCCSQLKYVEIQEGTENVSIKSDVFYKSSSDDGTVFSIPNNVNTIETGNFNNKDTIWCNKGSNIANYARENNINYIYDELESYTDSQTGITWEYFLKNESIAYGLEYKNGATSDSIKIPSEVQSEGYGAVKVYQLGGVYKNNFLGVGVAEFNNVEISEGIETLYERVFQGYNNTIIIPDSITAIQENVFYNHGSNLTVKCNPTSTAYKNITYYNTNNSDNSIKLIGIYQFNNLDLCRKIYNQLIEEGKEVLNYNENEMYFELKDSVINEIKSLNISGLNLENSNIVDLNRFLYLENLNADNNNISEITEWMCGLKVLSLNKNDINIMNLQYYNVNLEELYLSENNIIKIETYESNDYSKLRKLDLSKNELDNLSNIDNFYNSEVAKDFKLEINLDENYINDLSNLDLMVEKNFAEVSVKNQKLECQIYKKTYKLDELAPILKQVKDNKYNGGQDITYSVENCELDGEYIILPDEIDSESIAKITINGGVANGTECLIKPIDQNSFSVEYSLNEDELKLEAIAHIGPGMTFKQYYNDGNANIRYSINENNKGYSEYKTYNGPIILKYGNNKIKAKLFNIDMKDFETRELEYEVNIGEEGLKLNAIRKNSKIYIYSNVSNLKYSFEEDGIYNDYTEPVQNSDASKIYIKVNNEENVRQFNIEDSNISSEDEYAIYDTKIGTDIITRNSSRYGSNSTKLKDAIRQNGKIYINIDTSDEISYSYDVKNWYSVSVENSTAEIEDLGYDKIYIEYKWNENNILEERTIVTPNYLEEIYGVVKENAKVYSFSQERVSIDENNDRLLLINDENKIKEINENITNVTQAYDKVLVLKENNVYVLLENKELENVNNGVNIKLINGIYAVDNDNNILKCEYIDGNLKYIKCNDFTISGIIIKIFSVIGENNLLPYVLYENGSAQILKENGTTLEISNRAMDISAIDNKIYALEFDKIKTMINPLYKDDIVYSKKIELSNMLKENETSLKINNNGDILTNKGNLNIGTKKNIYVVTYSYDGRIEQINFDFNSSEEELNKKLQLFAGRISDGTNLDEVDKTGFENFLNKYSNSIFKINDVTNLENSFDPQNLRNILSLNFYSAERYNKFSNTEIRVTKIEDVLDSYSEENLKTNIKRLGNNTYQNNDGDIFYVTKKKEIINQNSILPSLAENYIYEDVQANKLINDIVVTKNENTLSENKVKINIEVPENKYRIKLPDGTELTSSTSFEVTQNGVYTIEFTDNEGYKSIRVVHVTNIQNRKETKVPVVVAINGKIKLESSEQIEYSVNEKNTWNDYIEEITYETPIYARIKNDNYECSILKIILDNNGKLEVYNEETREIQSKILTNALGKTGADNSYSEIYNDRTRVIKFAEEVAQTISNTPQTENNNVFNYISEIVEGIIYSFSATDGRYAGCYFKDNITEITYKDINNDVISIDMNKSVKNIAETSDQIDYAIINNIYAYINKSQLESITDESELTDEKIDEFVRNFNTNQNYNMYVKKAANSYAYIDNKGNLVSNIDIINKAKQQIGEETKYVKIVGEGVSFYILTQEGEVYVATESVNRMDGYFYAKLNAEDKSRHALTDCDIIYKLETRNIVDIFDTCTGLTKDGKSISLLYPTNEGTSVVQEIQKQTDKFLIASRLGLKNGKLYNFNNIHTEDGFVVANENNAKTNQVKKGRLVKIDVAENSNVPYNVIGIYSETENTVKLLERDGRDIISKLNGGESYIGVEEAEGDLPEFIDIAEYRDTYLIEIMKKFSRGTYYVANYDYASTMTPAIAISKDGEIYIYLLDSYLVEKTHDSTTGKYLPALDTRTGYVVDTGINLDYFGPTANYNLDNSNWTNQDIKLALSGNTKNEIVNAIIKKQNIVVANLESTENEKIEDQKVEVSKNGEYTYEIKDKRNRTYSGTVKVENIDKLKPIIPEIQRKGGKLQVIFKDDQEATEDFAKSGIKQRLISYDRENWEEVQENEKLLDVAENVILYAKSIDNAGNESDIASGSLRIQIGHVTVKYQDIDDGTTLKEDAQLSDVVGENYNIEVPEIENYDYKEAEGELSGEYANEEKIVILKYKAKEGKVTVKYQDENGEQIEQDTVYTGRLLESYTTRAKEITGFEFVEVKEGSAPESGTFKEEEQIIIYVYKKIEEPEPQEETGKVIVKYQDENGNSLKEDVILEGKVGEEYTSEKVEFETYDLIEIVGNASGIITKEEQVVIYKYNKKIGRVIIIYNDSEGIKIKENDIIEGKIDTDYKVARQIIDGYELIEIVGNEEGKYQLADQFIIYKYKKLEAPITLPQTGQSRIAYILVGIIILLSICGLIYIKWDDFKSKK